MAILALQDFISLWGFIAICIVVVFLSVEIGYRIGKYRKKNAVDSDSAPVGAIVGATLGLLAFILAFTFGMASDRFETKRALVLEESNTIETTYLRAGYLAEPEHSEIRKLLREYVNIRLAAALTATEGTQLLEALKKSEQIQDQLWAQATIIAKKEPSSVMAGLFIQSLNDLIDDNTKRVMAGLWSRIPLIIWITLFVITVLAMTSMGYMLGISGSRNLVAILTMTLGFISVIYLIASLDHPDGMIRVSQQAMIELQKKISS